MQVNFVSPQAQSTDDFQRNTQAFRLFLREFNPVRSAGPFLGIARNLIVLPHVVGPVILNLRHQSHARFGEKLPFPRFAGHVVHIKFGIQPESPTGYPRSNFLFRLAERMLSVQQDLFYDAAAVKSFAFRLTAGQANRHFQPLVFQHLSVYHSALPHDAIAARITFSCVISSPTNSPVIFPLLSTRQRSLIAHSSLMSEEISTIAIPCCASSPIMV